MADSNSTSSNTKANTQKSAKKHHHHRRRPKKDAAENDSHGGRDNSSRGTSTTSGGDRRPHRAHKKRQDDEAAVSDHHASASTTTSAQKQQQPSGDDNESDAESDASGDLCFICTEPIATYAVGQCDHRTCHLCALRLRALYKTMNCAYCKSEQPTVIFTKDAEKPFDKYTLDETPFVDKKLGLRFEDKQVYQDTMLLLQFNCPDPECDIACDGGWPELRRHVKKVHDRFICDLCTKHKKIFVHEHTLYTWPQLQKHIRQGDKAASSGENTGFKGHPECQFCHINYYGNDELFEHCRDKHEQCHICVRMGIRSQYYENYDSLEVHFKKDHYLCEYRECLDHKFVVFESDIDLKAHELEAHGGSVSRLPRAKQAEARRIDVNFNYGSSSRTNEREQRNRRNNQTRNETDQRSANAAAAEPGLSSQDFPSISGSQSNGTRQAAAASTKSAKQQSGMRRPAGFGGLSENWPTLGENTDSSYASTSSAPGSASSASVPSEIVSRHTALMERIFDMLKSHDKLAKFRALTTSYRNSNIDVDTYVNNIVELCDGNTDNISKIIKGVEDLIDSEEKKWEIVRAWRNKHTSMSNFPALEATPKSPAGHGTSSRVLVIKSRNTRSGGTRSTGKANVWDKVASAADSASVRTRTSPQISRANSPAPVTFSAPAITATVSSGVRTPWAGGSRSSGNQENDFPALGNPHFPSLPAAPKRNTVPGLRKNNSFTSLSAWDNSDRPTNPSSDEPPETEESSKGKKKGKKNKQYLFRVGL
ncbi:hypothetical protein BX666DRAFT_2029424 [Dichotomocladium elegans]|nr:hypothetical protein BX666DRAFT_2029424 [Dichotomocladium elegans]